MRLFLALLLCCCSLDAKEIKLFPHERTRVDLIAFSYNRPMQLYAFLESCERHLQGLGDIHVIYRSSASSYEAGYAEVKARFPYVFYQRQAGADDFKSLTLKAFNALCNQHCMFAVDDIIVTDDVDLTDCVRALHRYHAWGFYLRLGKNISYCYSLNKPAPPPKGRLIGNDKFMWRFSRGKGDWGYPNTVDMTIYRKSDLRSVLKREKYVNPTTLEGAFCLKREMSRRGICYTYSKNINLPLNIVSTNDNRQERSFAPQELLTRFQQGQKIDITAYFRNRNISPHVAYRPSFVTRAP